MREIAFHNGTAFFAEQDSGKGIFQFPLRMNGGMAVFSLHSLYPTPLFFCNDRLVETVIEIIVIVLNSLLG